MKEFTFEWMIEKYGLFFRKFGLNPDILRKNQNHTKTFDYAWEILHIIMGASYYAYGSHKITLEQDRIIDLEIQKIRIFMLKEKGHNVKLFQIQYLLDELKFIERTHGDELKGLELFSSGCCEYCDEYINKLLTPKEVLLQPVCLWLCQIVQHFLLSFLIYPSFQSVTSLFSFPMIFWHSHSHHPLWRSSGRCHYLLPYN